MVPKSTTSSISYVMCMLWSEIWTVGPFAFFLRLGHLFFQKVSSPCFDLRLNTVDVSKSWIQPSSHFQTSTLFTSPSLPQSPPPPSPSPGSCLIPLLTTPPWYSHYISSGYPQSLWNAGGIPGITGGWLVGWLLLGIGNTLPFSRGKQLLSASPFIYL